MNDLGNPYSYATQRKDAEVNKQREELKIAQAETRLLEADNKVDAQKIVIKRAEDEIKSIELSREVNNLAIEKAQLRIEEINKELEWFDQRLSDGKDNPNRK